MAIAVQGVAGAEAYKFLTEIPIGGAEAVLNVKNSENVPLPEAQK